MYWVWLTRSSASTLNPELVPAPPLSSGVAALSTAIYPLAPSPQPSQPRAGPVETAPVTQPASPAVRELPSIDLSILNVLNEASTIIETQPSQGTATDFEESYSAEYSNTSSIAIGRFPHFHFNLHSVVSLAQLSGTTTTTTNSKHFYQAARPGATMATNAKAMSRKVDLLLAILEVDGPDRIKVKKGAQAGTEVSILKLILGDEQGSVCRLTAWRETAEEWGGERQVVQEGRLGEGEGVKRGDVVYIQGRKSPKG